MVDQEGQLYSPKRGHDVRGTLNVIDIVTQPTKFICFLFSFLAFWLRSSVRYPLVWFSHVRSQIQARMTSEKLHTAQVWRMKVSNVVDEIFFSVLVCTWFYSLCPRQAAWQQGEYGK